jgi:hypothetical protein
MAQLTTEEIQKIFAGSDPLFKRIEAITAPPDKPLLLAHYTSVQVVEQNTSE